MCGPAAASARPRGGRVDRDPSPGNPPVPAATFDEVEMMAAWTRVRTRRWRRASVRAGLARLLGTTTLARVVLGVGGLGVGGLGVAALAAGLSPAGASAPAPAPAAGYVALGDSFTSAPAVTPQQAGSGACRRSVVDYPHLVAQAAHLSLTDVSCSGATTADVASGQLGALGPDTGLVTVGVGGDDLGFASIVAHCLAASPWGPTDAGWTCRSHYDAGGHDQLAAAVGRTGTAVAALLAAVHRRAPRATVLEVGYPAILPAAGDGCWPVVPFTRVDAGYLRQTELELNATLASVARAGGATFVDTYGPSVTHSACAPPAERWLEPVVPDEPAAPMHPDAAGEAAMARAVLRALAGRHPS